jgi:GNAT superfamily N-acetyltransferase
VIELRPTAYDHPDAQHLIGELQAVYRRLYGGEDDTPLDPAQFSEPYGYFVVAYADGVPVACGGWRAREEGEDPALRAGDAEIKRMYVGPAHRGHGYARALLADLERSAVAAGLRRAVLETGDRQPVAVGLYLSAGYTPIPTFGIYRHEPGARCFAKDLNRFDQDPDGELARSPRRVDDPRRLP